jgi:hypothetical protein
METHSRASLYSYSDVHGLGPHSRIRILAASLTSCNRQNRSSAGIAVASISGEASSLWRHATPSGLTRPQKRSLRDQLPIFYQARRRRYAGAQLDAHFLADR